MRERDHDAINTARRVFKIESAAVSGLAARLSGDFAEAVNMILATEGKVIVCGMGKSGIICQKIASTLASTGTASFFLHPAEGVHGDLGVVSKNDILIAVSNSGETDELMRIIPVVKRLGIKMIAMTGNMSSALADYADLVLDVGVDKEACPLGLSPTASTTATLAMGDALAVALLEGRGFSVEDFAKLHPAGSLGRRFMRVEDFMHSGKDIPMVGEDAPMREAVVEMTAKRLGLTGVFKGKALVGVITDGDLRRGLDGATGLLERKAGEVMSPNPATISEKALLEEALDIMEKRSITALFVSDEAGGVSGVIHLHDLIRGGVI
ncbi:MAG: SIS domain-containing protein [Thermodesulfobacteriota bacterium]